jgi:D-lactate dehydrogenase (cytochrome)
MIIKTTKDEIVSYLHDASNYKGFCDAVYFPENETDVISIINECRKTNTPITISGSGTGLTGARVPNGGIVIATDKLNHIIEINKEKFFAVTEPGVLLSEFQEKVNQQGLLYPPDPTERNCFIGGTIATNASGEKTFKYGPTRSYVEELHFILSDDEKLVLTRGKEKADGNELILHSLSGKKYALQIPHLVSKVSKNSAGYYCKKNMDAIDLFIGSEGTLGIITLAKLKLVSIPSEVISCVVFFKEELSALNFVREAREASFTSRLYRKENSIDALALEYYDKNSLKFLSGEYPQIPSNVSAAVWFEQEINESSTQETLLNNWLELIKKHEANEDDTWFASDDNERKELEKFRYSISSKVNEYVSSKGLKKLGTDAAVPDESFEKFYMFSKSLCESSALRYVIYGHFGNSHIHLNMLPENEDEYSKGLKIYEKICRKAVEMNGTVSAEHGIGKLKKNYLSMMYSEDDLIMMKKIKQTLDPQFLLGRGNIF